MMYSSMPVAGGLKKPVYEERELPGKVHQQPASLLLASAASCHSLASL